MNDSVARTRAVALLASTTAAALALAAACKKDEEVEYPQQGATNYAADPAPTTPATTTAAPEPTASAPAVQDAGPPPALDPTTLAALDKDVQKRRWKQAAGGKPQGEPFGAQLSQGQKLEQSIMLEQNKCYYVLAQGGLGVTEVNVKIQVTAPLPGGVTLPGTDVAVDNTTGNEAAITPCFKYVFPVPVPAKVVVEAASGSGPVAARVYVK